MRRNNVILMPGVGVTEILVEDGRAVGVRLEDGGEFYADKLVASSVDVHQTFKTMLPAEVRLPSEIQEEVDRYDYQDGILFSVHMAMGKIPTYKAAEFDPDINQAWVLNMGYECSGGFQRMTGKRFRDGKAPAASPSERGHELPVRSPDAPRREGHRPDSGVAPYGINGNGSGDWAT